MDGENDRLYKELERVKKELRVKEKQLSSMQKSMQICENELVALEEECKEKIVQVQHEQEKNLNEEEFVRALEMKDNQVRAMKADIDALSEANAQRTGEIASLKAELVNAVESKDTLWTAAASASNESEQLIQSLRFELQDTLAAMNILKREHTESKNAMYSRQSQLESVNTELMNNVASLERELAKARAATSAGSQTRSTDGASVTTVSSSAPFGANAINDDYRRVQQTLIVTKKLLHDKSRTNEIQKQEIVALTDEVHRLEQVIATAEEHSTRQLDAVSIENEKLREQVERLASQNNAAMAASDEQRIQRLTNTLIEKQETIDSLRSRVTTMDVRLQDIQLQGQQAKEQLARVMQHGGIDDMEMATSIGKTDRNGMRSRPNRMANMISRVVPVVERSHRVLTVLDVLDRWLLFLGRVFLQAPFARLGMLCYIVLIHLWVFIIISFHTSHLTEETQFASAAENAIFEPGEDLIPGAGH
uniref:Golgin-84 n=1 Tax=Hyaloperonospora arabidopsidis (strain Emoy2) TaxID=559515 RepID=M4BHG0_HYAAE